MANDKVKIKIDNKKKNKKKEIKLVLLNEDELIQQVCLRPVIYDRSLKGYRRMSLRKQCWSDISKTMGVTDDECRKRWRSLRDAFSKHYKATQRPGNKQRKWQFYDKMSFLIPHIDGVSYDLDNILDEFGDISEDNGSINSEPTALNSISEELEQPDLSLESSKEIKEHRDEFQEELQRTSVSVQATIQSQSPLNINDKNNVTTSNEFSRNPHTYKNYNTSTNATFCGETNGYNGVIHDSEEKFLLSCAPTLRRLTHRQNALARLKIQQILFDIEFDQNNT